MVSFVKSVTFDCADPMLLAAFWASALGSNVDEDSTPERAWVEPAGWGGPSLWFQKVPERKRERVLCGALTGQGTSGPFRSGRRWSRQGP